MSGDEYVYPGEELEAFSHAVNWKQYFAALLRPYVRGAVLEVGAGLGGTTSTLWNHTIRRWVCVEPDPRLAQRLTVTLSNHDPLPEIIVGDIDRVPRAAQFDCVVYIDVLEHIRDDAAQLEAASSRLHPGGHLVVLSPAFPLLYSEFDRLLGHERRYTKRTLSRVIPGELERIELFYADSVGMLLSLGNRLLLRQSMPSDRQIRFWDRRVIPVSRIVDRIVRHSFGRSIIAVYRRSMSSMVA
jgi:SAM-dependent methyltransferase